MTRGLLAKRPYPVQDVEAGHLRHHQVEDQNIRLLPLDCLEGLLTVESNRRAESSSCICASTMWATSGIVVCEHQPPLGAGLLRRPGTACGCQLPADPGLSERFVGLRDQSLDGRPATPAAPAMLAASPVCPFSVIAPEHVAQPVARGASCHSGSRRTRWLSL